jgi:hypothetical protein
MHEALRECRPLHKLGVVQMRYIFVYRIHSHLQKDYACISHISATVYDPLLCHRLALRQLHQLQLRAKLVNSRIRGV